MTGAGGRPGPRRVAVVVPKYGLVGGGERFAYELTERLARDPGYEFHVFANRWAAGPGPIAYHRVPAVRFPRWLRPLSFSWFAGRMTGGRGFDIVHAHERIGRADVFTMHAVPHRAWVRDIRRKGESLFDRATIGLERRMMAGAGRPWFLPVSTLAAEALRAEYDVDPARLRVVHPGVDAARFDAPDRAACRAEIRGRHGIGKDDLLVLFVGMNFEVKGLAQVIAGLGAARRAAPAAGVRLLVVGRGDERKYAAIAREHGVGEAVSFAGPRAGDVERFYRAADLFAMLSSFDTFGMAVLEAMAAGLPVVVSRNVGARDLVEEGGNGSVAADPGDPAAVGSLFAAMADPAARARAGARARETARACSWDAAAAEVAAVYERVLDSRTA